jgi:hypothetical protein
VVSGVPPRRARQAPPDVLAPLPEPEITHQQDDPINFNEETQQ